jgi:HEAT repeat protein
LFQEIGSIESAAPLGPASGLRFQIETAFLHVPNNSKIGADDMKVTFLTACVLALALTGCGESEPRLADGKPLSYWVKSLETGNAKHRRKAVFKLGNACTANPTVLSVVLGVLKDRDPGVRCEAILAMVKNGRAARAAIPALFELQQHDPNAQVRSYAARAKDKIRRGT